MRRILLLALGQPFIWETPHKTHPRQIIDRVHIMVQCNAESATYSRTMSFTFLERTPYTTAATASDWTDESQAQGRRSDVHSDLTMISCVKFTQIFANSDELTIINTQSQFAGHLRRDLARTPDILYEFHLHLAHVIGVSLSSCVSSATVLRV